ncbi:MAG: hypothetical protein AAF723_01500 [Pseudomonadota bacterium]
MKEVAQFADAEEAYVALGYLKAQGLDVHLADKQSLAAMPYLQIGLDGFRLVADEKDVHLAKQLLNDIHEEATEGPTCANCGSHDLKRIRAFRPDIWFLFLLHPVLPFAPPTDMLRCRHCGHKQPITDEEDDQP